MAPTLGKRKRRTPETISERRESSVESSNSLEEDAQAIFKRHFEAQFKPLPTVKKTVKVFEAVPNEDEDNESDWNGISEPESTGSIEVIEHATQSRTSAMSKEELKAFMSSKPPSATLTASIKIRASATPADDDISESANLKKDLALQRLLAESHLLDSSGSPTLTGTNRHKATDLRLQALGSKKSILTQEKMPMSHRKGIIAKKGEREEIRRREARENGIILEKVKGNTKRQNDTKRERGIGGPGIGKFSGGTLTLSKKDIHDIEGPRKTFTGKSGGRGRGGSGRGGKRGKSRG